MTFNPFHHREAEVFGEARLCHRGGGFRAGGRGRVGGGEAEAGGSAERADEREPAEQSTVERLRALHRDLDKNRARRANTPEHHSIRRDSRDDLEMERPENPATYEAIKRAEQLEGLMTREQLESMQNTHEVISSHYMDPAFMLSIDALRGHPVLDSDEVYTALNTILANPYAFDYSYNAGTQITQVRKRAGTSFAEVPDVSLTIKKGVIDEVDGKSLRGPNGNYPWDGIDYQSRMQRYKDRFDYEWSQGVYPEFYAGPWRTIQDETARNQVYTEMQMEAFRRVSPQMQETYLHNNVTIPLRLIQLIEARHFDFETQNPEFRALTSYKAHLEMLKGLSIEQAYERITQNRDQDLKLLVVSHPSIPDAYIIGMRDHPNDTLVVHKNGYLMYENASGIWVPYPQYGAKLTQDYFEANRDRNAEALIGSDAMSQRLQAAGTEVAEISAMASLREYARPVTEAVQNANWEQIKRLAYAVGGPEQKAALDHYFRQWEPHKNKAEVMAPVISAIREPILASMQSTVDVEGTKELINEIAGVLGVTLTAETPPPTTGTPTAETPEVPTS